MSILTPIKRACPPEITFDNIKAVIAYLQVREHLNKLNIQYKDFETKFEIENTLEAVDCKENKILDSVLQIANEIDTTENMDQQTSEVVVQPEKKLKLDKFKFKDKNIKYVSILDSPPRETKPNSSLLEDNYFDNVDFDSVDNLTSSNQKSDTNKSNKNDNKGKLPPWLCKIK